MSNGRSICVANVYTTSHCCIRVFCNDDLYHMASSASSETTPTSILYVANGCHESFDDTPMVLFDRDEQISVS